MRNIYFKLFYISLRIPFVRKIALLFYIWAGARVKKNRKSAEASIFILYEPRFTHIVRELADRGIDVIILSRGFFDYMFRKHLREYIENNQGNFGEYTLSVYLNYKENRRHLSGRLYLFH